MNSPLALVIHGASGRNGKRLIALGSSDPQVKIVGALVRKSSTALGQDAGLYAGIASIGLPIEHRWPDSFDAVIDFSSPEGCMEALEACLKHGKPIVIATTGLEKEHLEKIQKACVNIEAEMEERVKYFKGEDKLLEAQRIAERTNFDIEMLKETGFCSGIENYSRHLAGLPAGADRRALPEGEEKEAAEEEAAPWRGGGGGGHRVRGR